MGELVGRHSPSAVFNGNDQLAGLLFGPDPHLTFSFDGLERIRQDVHKDLVHAAGRTSQGRDRSILLHHSNPIPHLVLEQSQSRFQGFVHVNRLAFRLIQCDKILERIDNALHPRARCLRGLVDLLNCFGPLLHAKKLPHLFPSRQSPEAFLQPPHGPIERVGIAGDDAERGIDLVGDAGSQSPNRSQLLGLNHLRLSISQIGVGRTQILIGLREGFGSLPHLVFERDAVLPQLLVQLTLFHGDSGLAGQRFEKPQVGPGKLFHFSAAIHVDDADQPVLHLQRDAHHTAQTERPDAAGSSQRLLLQRVG